MNIKILFLTNALIYPYDEGFRKFAFYLYEYFRKLDNSTIYILNKNPYIQLQENIKFINVNKLFLDINFLKKIKGFDKIIYFPLSSITFNSILRAFILGKYTKDINIIGLQKRNYNKIQKYIIDRIKCVNYIVQTGDEHVLSKEPILIDSGIDAEKFYVISDEKELNSIKNHYCVPCYKKILLHIGHIKAGRNIDELIKIQNTVNNVQIVLIGSTSSECDVNLKQKCIESGIIVIDYYVEKIVELYNVADCYLFLAKEYDNFISKPLSVLEALACGIPVIGYKDVLEKRFSNIEHGINLVTSFEQIVDFIQSNKFYSYKNCKEFLSQQIREQYNWHSVIHNTMKEIIDD